VSGLLPGSQPGPLRADGRWNSAPFSTIGSPLPDDLVGGSVLADPVDSQVLLPRRPALVDYFQDRPFPGTVFWEITANAPFLEF